MDGLFSASTRRIIRDQQMAMNDAAGKQS